MILQRPDKDILCDWTTLLVRCRFFNRTRMETQKNDDAQHYLNDWKLSSSTAIPDFILALISLAILKYACFQPQYAVSIDVQLICDVATYQAGTLRYLTFIYNFEHCFLICFFSILRISYKPQTFSCICP